MSKVKLVPDKNSLNESLPIDDWHNVLSWVIPSQPNWSQYVEPIRKRTKFCIRKYQTCRDSKTEFLCDVPKTLVCHDMKGGYLNDRFNFGHQQIDDYKFVHWACIDIFVYFSHNFLTIPPLSWINAGHLHGVKVLGTIITENKEGIAAWKEICVNKRLVYKLAYQIANICKHYKFDGYLLNIENQIDSCYIQDAFIFFIKTLYDNLKKINPENLLIWYDAVTNEGFLEWQNCLNSRNSDFFNACDGIFLNYDWTKQALISSAALAGARRLDVFVGIDIFGRGVFGGGGFSTDKGLALVRKYKLSVALFAPGWVHETCEKGINPDIRDFKFWSLISNFLYTHGPAELPFRTSFCRGYGNKSFEDGLVVTHSKWVNQAKINHLPTLLTGLFGLVNNSCVSYYDKDGFSGGGSLLVSNCSQDDNLEHSDCLLICDFLRNTGKLIILEVVYKPLNTGTCQFDLIITTGENFSGNHRSTNIPVVPDESNKVNLWYKSQFKLDFGDEHIFGISITLTGNRIPILLGGLKIYST